MLIEGLLNLSYKVHIAFIRRAELGHSVMTVICTLLFCEYHGYTHSSSIHSSGTFVFAPDRVPGSKVWPVKNATTIYLADLKCEIEVNYHRLKNQILLSNK